MVFRRNCLHVCYAYVNNDSLTFKYYPRFKIGEVSFVAHYEACVDYYSSSDSFKSMCT